MKFDLKNGKTVFESLISPSFDEIHCLTKGSYEPHGTYVSGFTFLLYQEGPKKPQSFFSLLSRGWNSLPGACSDLDLGHCNMHLTLHSFSLKQCSATIDLKT